MANEDVPARSEDPRAAAILSAPLVAEFDGIHDLRSLLVHRTRTSALRMAAVMDHLVDGPEGTVTENESMPDMARVTVSAEVGHGETLTLTKLLAYGWSSERSMVSIRDQADAAISSARRTGFDGLLEDQREYLDDFWERADVEIDGDDELQQAVRFALFHTLQAAARAEKRAIPAKGLTGDGYDGHVFWDTESYVLPVLTYTAPDAVRDALCWRHSTLDLATERARTLRLEGAAFPWRTIRGHECSAYWPAGTAAFHINADISDAVLRYVNATADEDFARAAGLELLVATARLWRSLGHHDARGTFHIDGVTGPDEYSAIADDNVYTNLLAARNLAGAAESCARHRERGRGARGRRRGDGRVARRGRQDRRALRRGAGRPPAVGGLHAPRAAGTSRRPTPTSTRCCCTSPTSTSIASRSSSRPTSCSRWSPAAIASPPRRRRAPSPTTSR